MINEEQLKKEEQFIFVEKNKKFFGISGYFVTSVFVDIDVEHENVDYVINYTQNDCSRSKKGNMNFFVFLRLWENTGLSIV